MASIIHISLSSIIFFFSSPALACAVCMGGTPKNVLDTYLWITLTLSLIPISFAVFGIYFYKKHVKNKSKKNSSADD